MTLQSENSVGTAPRNRLELCAHLGYQFAEFAPVERIAAAAQAGFKAVEWPSVYQFDAEDLRGQIEQRDVEWVQVTLPVGDAAIGEKGLAALPGREGEFEDGLKMAIRYALALKAKWIHPMAGVLPFWAPAAEETYLFNLRLTLKQARLHNLGVLIEVINPKEVPGYGMGSYELAADIFDKLANDGAPYLLLDAYHGQVLTGDLLGLTRKWAGRIGHVQIADVPGRHEPGTGKLDFQQFFRELQAGGYDGWVGCEYKPQTTTLAGMHHLARYMRTET